MTRSLIFIVTALILILMIAGCAAKPSEESGAETNQSATQESDSEKTVINEKINAETAKKMIDAGGVTIVDVRSPAEYSLGHIPGSVLAPLNELPSQAASYLPDKDATLLVYCRSGNRSAQAVNILRQLGYTRLYDFGGIINWPYDIEK